MNQQLTELSRAIRAALSEKDAARDAAVRRSRELIRLCSECIRAIHRHDWNEADDKMKLIQSAASEMREGVAAYPDLYHSGYTQDAMKEVVEAFITSAIIREQPLPTPQALQVEDSTYLNGMAEAATELRRFILDMMRRDDSHSDEAERLLAWMD
ncbi:MAG TPA: hypothetical protein VHL11_23965, partial [Phototrophicaceae bacterium]|nr:hypothetical protein [Phototrophicaceae bacterium]